MNENPKISVIIPVYKAELYLDRCVESIVNQTYKNLEILLVDDGSPDSSPKMCDVWSTKDNRIKVIHKKNGGTSDARNTAVKVSKGEFISFVDNDDILDPCFYEIMIKSLIEADADLSACDVFSFYNENEITQIDTKGYIVRKCDSEQALSELINGKGFRAVVWNKLYKKDLVLSVKFDTKRLREDEFFTYKVFDKCKNLVFVELALYNYRQHEGSIMATPSQRHIEDVLDSGYERLSLFKTKYPNLYKSDKITFCIGCINSYKTVKNNDYKDKELLILKIKKYRRDIKFSFSDFKKYSFKEKMYIIFSNPKLIWLGAKLR